MQNISLDFFGEKITALMPRDLASLRNIIADRFMFDPEDAAEVIITYMKDLGKKIIKTEEDFKTFLNEKINLISLDISQDSKLYKENFANIEHENVEKKNELENLKKKKEEEISEKKKTINEFTKNVKNIDDQIKKLENTLETSIEKSFDKSSEKSYDKSLTQSLNQVINGSITQSYNQVDNECPDQDNSSKKGKGILNKLIRIFSLNSKDKNEKKGNK